MDQTMTLTFTLPLSQAEKVIALVKSFNPSDLGLPINGHVAEAETGGTEPSAPIEFTPIFLHDQKLKYLVDGLPNLQKTIRFIVQKCGEFYNDDLSAELGYQDSRNTSAPLGQITRKLRKTGIRADGFRGQNWYRTVPSSGRTLILVREDVLPVLAEALEN